MIPETSLSRLQISSGAANAEIFTQGAHVASFETQSGDAMLWLSRESRFEIGKPIRGGVPLIFPYFGPKDSDPQAPAHGFARTAEWQTQNVTDSDATLILESNAATLAAWPHPFRLIYRVRVQAEKLGLRLEIHNTGEAEFRFEVALHTYFRVSDARGVSIEGLDGKTYIDKTQGGARQTQSGAIRIGAETDRVYLDSSGPITLRDGARSVKISDLGGVKSSVVWNPWIAKAKALADLGDDEWPEFVCIESGVIADDAETLAPGAIYSLEIEIEAARAD